MNLQQTMRSNLWINHLVGAVLLNESIEPVCKSDWIKYKDHLAESWKESVRQLGWLKCSLKCSFYLSERLNLMFPPTTKKKIVKLLVTQHALWLESNQSCTVSVWNRFSVVFVVGYRFRFHCDIVCCVCVLALLSLWSKKCSAGLSAMFIIDKPACIMLLLLSASSVVWSTKPFWIKERVSDSVC